MTPNQYRCKTNKFTEHTSTKDVISTQKPKLVKGASKFFSAVAVRRSDITMPNTSDKFTAPSTCDNLQPKCGSQDKRIPEGDSCFWLSRYLCHLSQVLGAVHLSEVFGIVISLLRTATALKNLEAPFTSYGFWIKI